LRELRGPRRGRYSIRGTECVATNAAWRDQANGDDGSDDETGAHWPPHARQAATINANEASKFLAGNVRQRFYSTRTCSSRL